MENKTKIAFDLIKQQDELYADLNNIEMYGAFNIHLLQNELIDQEKHLRFISDKVNAVDGAQKVFLEIWEDSDDYRTWLEWKVISEEDFYTTSQQQTIERLRELCRRAYVAIRHETNPSNSMLDVYFDIEKEVVLNTTEPIDQ